MGKWKRGVWTCLLLLVLEAGAFRAHLVDARVRYMLNVSEGGPAPFGVYALPVWAGHGAVMLLLLGAGVFCWRKSRIKNDG